MRKRDYIDPRMLEAVDKAALILERLRDKWSNELDAYWLLRRYEDEVGIPVTYDIVEQAVAKVSMDEAKSKAIAKERVSVID